MITRTYSVFIGICFYRLLCRSIGYPLWLDVAHRAKKSKKTIPTTQVDVVQVQGKRKRGPKPCGVPLEAAALPPWILTAAYSSEWHNNDAGEWSKRKHVAKDNRKDEGAANSKGSMVCVVCCVCVCVCCV